MRVVDGAEGGGVSLEDGLGVHILEDGQELAIAFEDMLFRREDGDGVGDGGGLCLLGGVGGVEFLGEKVGEVGIFKGQAPEFAALSVVLWPRCILAIPDEGFGFGAVEALLELLFGEVESEAQVFEESLVEFEAEGYIAGGEFFAEEGGSWGEFVEFAAGKVGVVWVVGGDGVCPGSVGDFGVKGFLSEVVSGEFFGEHLGDGAVLGFGLLVAGFGGTWGGRAGAGEDQGGERGDKDGGEEAASCFHCLKWSARSWICAALRRPGAFRSRGRRWSPLTQFGGFP